ncbi:hypothetical protein FQN55_008842 [Onygenales sp. PD_40]|nr:hypothetical protein FQN55_008842 [Onygenales sp. PD_40]
MSTTTNRRIPLVNVPNGTNSPHRGVAALASMKRTRPIDSRVELAHAQQPPLKKQMLDKEDVHPNYTHKSPRKLVVSGTEGKVFTRRNTNSQLTAFEKKLVAVRDKERSNHNNKNNNSRGVKHDRAGGESLDSIRQWQKHYRKVFPQFVFYFEGIPEDVRNKCSRQIMALGANEEKFFSKAVTHVVTARPIPPEIESPNSADPPAGRPSANQHGPDDSIQTVDPSLLEKKTEMRRSNLAAVKWMRETDFRCASIDGDWRGVFPDNKDVLHRARQMHMKIWALEKLQRVISTMNDGSSNPNGHYTLNNGSTAVSGRGRAELDLSHVLRNERLNGPADRDAVLASKEIIPFKGPFVYVHDIEEKTRPVMVREYPKVAKRQDGTWPQFRSAPLGKCPFIDEPPSKKEVESRKTAAQAKEKERKMAATKTAKPPAPAEIKTMQPPKRSVEKRALRNVEGAVNHKPTKGRSIPPPKRFDILLMLPKPGDTHPGAKDSLATYVAREPAASGVQPSNITSAIRSQMISSTAAAPGAKAGTSKEVHGLKRKVLEKGNGALSMSGIPASHRMTDIAGALKASRAPTTRGAKNKPQDKLDQIDEDGTTQSEEDKTQKVQALNPKNNTIKQVKQKKRDPKPGYCENCRDKFDDFDEHVTTRKHRKFALTLSNWTELDDLLDQLGRRFREDM